MEYENDKQVVFLKDLFFSILYRWKGILIAALILVCGLGFNTYPLILGPIQLGGLAVAALVGIIANAILPGKDYEFKMEDFQ